jgi:DeoR/GlpR family transcriptional regulator of sugar metabolism
VLASQRRATILGLVEDSGAVRVSELVEQLGVSDMTVRRDIEQLATEGLVERVHGGALAVGGRSSEEPGFTAKSALMQAQKNSIAMAAAQLVEPGAAIGISAGTTTYEFARAVRTVPDLTVVTNSVPVAQLLHESGAPGQTVVLTGGIRTPSDALVDHSKWGTVGLSTIIPLASVDLLVTDPGLGPRAQQALTDAGVEVVLAAPTTARTARNQRSQA